MRTGGEGSCELEEPGESDSGEPDQPRPAGGLEDREDDERLAPRLTAREELPSRSPEVDRASREARGRSSVPEDPEADPSDEEFEDFLDGRLSRRRLAGSSTDEADEPEPEDREDEEREEREDEPDDFEDPKGGRRPRTLAGSPPEALEEPERFEEREEEEPEEPEEPERSEELSEERCAPRLTALAEPDSRSVELLAGGEGWRAGVCLAALEEDEEPSQEPSPPLLEDLGE